MPPNDSIPGLVVMADTSTELAKDNELFRLNDSWQKGIEFFGSLVLSFLQLWSCWEHRRWSAWPSCSSPVGAAVSSGSFSDPQGCLTQGCALRKIEGRPVLWTCKIQGAQHMICMKNLRFSSRPGTKVGCQRPPGSARARPCWQLLTWWVPMAKPTPALRHSSLLHPLQKKLDHCQSQ